MKNRRLTICILSAALAVCSMMGESRLVDGKLIVDDKPYIVLGGELGNSSASSVADIQRIFPQLKERNLNTVLVPAYWDLLEPEEGKYDFSLTDAIIDEARKNDLKIVFLWFGAWKNSMSCYAPLWFKKDTCRFPRAVTSTGKPLEIASAFSESVLETDKKAFMQLINHLADTDKDGTVVMIQVENEIGMLEDARDHSAAADSAYNKGVPAELIKYLNSNKKNLHPELLKKWADNGYKTNGTWKEMFGDDIYTDEIFMAWNYAKYVEQLAKESKRLLSTPLYVNAALNSRGRRPGEYPSAGPLAHLKDVWKCAAPHIDFLSPDIYDKGFKDWVGDYSMTDNILFVPEIRSGEANGAQAFYVLGEHDALGLSPFSIENDNSKTTDKAYETLQNLQPLISKYQGTGKMKGVFFDMTDKERVLNMGDTKVTANHFFTLPWDSRATDGSQWPSAGGIIIQLNDDEFIVAGTGIVVKFENISEVSENKKLGEDGFLNSGEERNAAKEWHGGKRVGLGPVDEVKVNPDCSLKYIRRNNGDETHQGRHVRIGVDDFKILHVKTYQY